MQNSTVHKCACVRWLDASVVCICAVAGRRSRQRLEAKLRWSSSCTLALQLPILIDYMVYLLTVLSTQY